MFFPVKIAKLLKIPFLKNTFGGYFCIIGFETYLSAGYTYLQTSENSDILINELRVTSYELRLLHKLWVTSYFYCTSYELLFAYELRVTVCCTSYELLFTYELRVTAYSTSYELLLLHELRVIVYYTSYELLFIARFTSYFLHTSYELLFIARVTSYFLNVSYSKYKDDKAVYYNKVMIKNYSLGSFFDKELGTREASFSCCLHFEWPTQKLIFYNMISL